MLVVATAIRGCSTRTTFSAGCFRIPSIIALMLVSYDTVGPHLRRHKTSFYVLTEAWPGRERKLVGEGKTKIPCPPYDVNVSNSLSSSTLSVTYQVSFLPGIDILFAHNYSCPSLPPNSVYFQLFLNSPDLSYFFQPLTFAA